MRPIVAVLLVLALTLPGWACGAGPDTWTEGDRKVNNQAMQGTTLTLGRVEAIYPLVADRPMAVEILNEAKSNLVTVELNLKHVEQIHGPPKEIVKFSSKASSDARNESTQDHSKKGVLEWIYTIGTYIGIAVGIGTMALNLPVIGPYLATTRIGQMAARVLGGKIVKVGLDGLKTISTLRAQAEEKPLTPQDVVAAAVQTFSPKTAAIADKVSDQIEAANNIKVTPIRQLESTPS